MTISSQVLYNLVSLEVSLNHGNIEEALRSLYCNRLLRAVKQNWEVIQILIDTFHFLFDKERLEKAYNRTSKYEDDRIKARIFTLVYLHSGEK